MSKELKIFLVTALIIAAAMLGYMLCCGDELTVSLEMPVQATGGTVTTAYEDIVRVESCQCENGTMSVRLRAIGKGSTAAHVNWEPVDNEEMSIYNLDMTLSTTPFGGVRESLGGNFTGWKALPVGAALIFISASIALFAAFNRRRHGRLYSYVTVMCAALGIFTLLLAVISLVFALEAIFEPGLTLWLMYLRLATACQDFIIWTSPVAAVIAFALLVSGIVLIRHEGFEKGNLFGIAVALMLIVGTAGGIALFYSRWLSSARNAVCSVYASLLCYADCLLFSAILCAYIAAVHTPDYNKDFIVILGCRVRPDGGLYPLIQSRVDKALDFAARQESAGGKRAKFIPSGGKGSDESLAEAEGMARYLRSKGVDDERIILEKQSRNTWENMVLSKAIADRLHPDAKAAFCTSGFHVFRSGILASQAGWNADGMGSGTRWYYWPNAFAREFIGLLANRVWAHLAIMAATAAIFTVMTLSF